MNHKYNYMKKLLYLSLLLVTTLLTNCGDPMQGQLVGAQGREVWFQPDPYGMLFIPMGSYNNPTICDKDTLFSVQESLQNTTIKNEDFETILEYAKAGDFVYFDPPYDTLTNTANFTSYNMG